MNKVIIVDDDKFFCKLIEIALSNAKYQHETIYTYEDAIDYLKSKKSDEALLYILDYDLGSSKTGLDLCRKIFIEKGTPILMLTASENKTILVDCLNSGANQYVIKPFGLNEFLARVSASIRSGGNNNIKPSLKELKLKNLTLKTDTKILKYDTNNQSIKITDLEIIILAQFFKNPNKILSKEEMFLILYGPSARKILSRSLDMAIARLRKKIKNSKFPIEIQAVRGFGYQLIRYE